MEKDKHEINWDLSFEMELCTKKFEGSITFEPIQLLEQMTLAVVTPTRGDRKQFLDFCKEQIDKQTSKPDYRYVVDYQPLNSQPDLTQRIKAAWRECKKNRVTYLAIVEDDDLYPENYIDYFFSSMEEGKKIPDFWGFSSTLYYHIKNRTWMYQRHPGRSSLFCTIIRVDALDDFNWPADHYLWLDIALWNHARDTRKIVKLIDEPICIGIKHSVGMCAGKAHKWNMENKDPDMSFLKSKVSDWQFEFYSKLKL